MDAVAKIQKELKNVFHGRDMHEIQECFANKFNFHLPWTSWHTISYHLSYFEHYVNVRTWWNDIINKCTFIF